MGSGGGWGVRIHSAQWVKRGWRGSKVRRGHQGPRFKEEKKWGEFVHIMLDTLDAL